jgi:hypothetical protein
MGMNGRALRTEERLGAPGETRTPDPQVRSLMLYPTELRAHREPTAAIVTERGRSA